MLKLPQLSSTVSNPAVPAMAQGDSNIQAAAEKIKEEERRLKYFAFVQVTAVSAALCFSNLYVYTKKRTGPLKPAVDIVEGIVECLVRLVFDKYFDDPVQLLKLVNPNVGEFVTKIDGLVRPAIRQVSSEAISTAQKAAGVAGDVVIEVQSAGVVSTASGFINQVSSEAISVAQKAPELAGGVATGVQPAGVVGRFGTKMAGLVPPVIQQVSSEAISVAQNTPGVIGGVATDVQRAGMVSTAPGFVNQVSSEAISAAQKAPAVAGGLANEIQEEEQLLKCLAFVQVTAVHAVLCFADLYLYAKERSGPLKPSVQFVEGIVKNMFQLVYDKYFGDPKVGEFVTKIDGLVPPVIKQVSSEAILAAQKAAGVAGVMSTEVQHVGAGLVSTASGFIKQVSPETISAVRMAPRVAEGLATEVERSRVVPDSVTKIDNLVSPVFKQVSSEAILAAQNAPVVARSVTTEVQHAGVLGNASGFIKQVSSEAILAAQNAPGVAAGVASLVQRAGAVGEPVTKIDDPVPSVSKQVSSKAISDAQKAPTVAGGVATEVQRAGVASDSTGFLRQVSSEAISAAQRAPRVSQGVATELQRAGVVNTTSGFAKSVAKGLYAKYEPKAEQYAVSTWRKLNHLPLFPQIASVVVPTAAYFTDKYNQTVVSRAEKGYKVASYLPLVPTEKIAKVFSEEKLES